MRLWVVGKRQPMQDNVLPCTLDDGSRSRGQLHALNPPWLPSIPPAPLAAACCQSYCGPSACHHPPLIPLLPLLLLMLRLPLPLLRLPLQDFVLLMCGALGRCGYSTSTIEVRAEGGRGKEPGAAAC